MNTRSRLPEQGWRAVGRHGGLLPLTVVPSHFSLVFVKPVRIPRYRLAASNISPLFDAARRARCVDVSERPSSRHRSHASERKAGQRRRALSGAAGAEPRAENRCLPIFEHGEHQPSTLTKTDPLLLTETDPASAHVLVVSWPAQPIAGMLQATIPLFDRRDHSSVPTCVPHDMASGGGQ